MNVDRFKRWNSCSIQHSQVIHVLQISRVPIIKFHVHSVIESLLITSFIAISIGCIIYLEQGFKDIVELVVRNNAFSMLCLKQLRKTQNAWRKLAVAMTYKCNSLIKSIHSTWGYSFCVWIVWCRCCCYCCCLFKPFTNNNQQHRAGPFTV